MPWLQAIGKWGCLASRWAASLQARPSSSLPSPQGCRWTSTSTTICTCQQSSSRPSSGSFLSPCSPLTSTPMWWASSVSAPCFPPQLCAFSAELGSGLDLEQAGLACPPRKVWLGSPLWPPLPSVGSAVGCRDLGLGPLQTLMRAREWKQHCRCSGHCLRRTTRCSVSSLPSWCR